jgi:hypothetical protein
MIPKDVTGSSGNENHPTYLYLRLLALHILISTERGQTSQKDNDIEPDTHACFAAGGGGCVGGLGGFRGGVAVLAHVSFDGGLCRGMLREGGMRGGVGDIPRASAFRQGDL